MGKKDVSVNELEGNILKELKSGTVDLVVEHELHGITPEMLQWWWWNMVDSRYYQLWHPKDHIGIEWEVPPAKGRLIGAIRNVEESIGEFPVRKLRIRIEDPALSPIVATYSYVNATSIIGLDDKPVAWITHEYKAESYGVRMRSTFRLSANTPQEFIDALRKHNIEEMGRLPEFLPELYKKNSG